MARSGVGRGEHHNAADAALDFLGNCGRMGGLRLHSHAETKKKATDGNRVASGAGRISAWLFLKKKGALIGRAAGEPHRSLKKLNQVCDPRSSLSRDEARRITANYNARFRGRSHQNLH